MRTSPPASEAEPRITTPSLYRDERGAMMVTGLFMSIFLVGTLWFLIGIGDALVFRDRMQEATDHGAFAASALHAKGMNFIALMNLIMIVATVIHLVLGIISDIKFAQLIKTGVDCIPALAVPPAFALCIAGPFADFMAAYDRWTKYFQGMKRGFQAIHVAQKVAANAYPGLGVVEAYQVGTSYGGDRRTGPVRVVAVSTSLFPGSAAGALAAKLPGAGDVGDSMKKESLPVRARKFADLCNYTVKFGTNAALQLFGAGSLQGGSLEGNAVSVFNKVVGTSLQIRYCNGGDVPSLDDFPFSTVLDGVSKVIAGTLSGVPPFGHGFDKFWDEEGPFVVWSPAANGNDWFQTWAFNVSPTLKDASESKVGLAAKQFQKYTREETPASYFAQSEFYFNCKEKWSTPNCNFEDHAMFAINWRARLRRVKDANVLGLILGAGFQMISDFKPYGDGKDKIGEKIEEMIGGGLVTKGLVDQTVGALEGWLKGIGMGAVPGTQVKGDVYH